MRPFASSFKKNYERNATLLTLEFEVPKGKHITIRVWLGHVISITREAAPEKLGIDICTSSLQMYRSADEIKYPK